MRLSICLLVCLLAVSAAQAERRVRGVVTDESNGVLPGVTVVAAAADGRLLATTVTDGAGRYTLGPIAAGRVAVTFELQGFAPATTQVDVGETADAVVDQRLLLARQSETVVVEAPAPRPVPAPPPMPVPRPRPRPVVTAVADHDPDAVCGPAKLERAARPGPTIRARRSAANGLYGAGDELEIEGGTAAGLQAGGNYTVRRTFRIEWEPREPIGEHTAGLVQIVSADARSAVAVVVYACDEIEPGDRLVAFTPPPRRAAEPRGTPDFRYAAKILFPDIGQLLGAPRRKLVIDRGTSSGVRVGQHATLFARDPASGAPIVSGDAIVIAVRRDSATVRVEHLTRALSEGDWAALER